ncbi:alpha/beta fold hydrolase [Dactylosporangium sp. NPDC050688]|uniref:alpha/beta hydrolase n=1 Tax=Dactylosporangium sp. NPDC050688 TaxID=3157217 RepID=UPI0033F18DBB
MIVPADNEIRLDLSGGPEVIAEVVHFDSDGLRLRGVLVEPKERPGPLPALVASHGWSGAVNFRVLPFAARLAQRGYAVLAIDHRGFGGSEGARLRCDPAEQVRDVSNAATYLAGLPEIDPSALGVVGASFGGGIAVAAAAADERLKACIGIVALGDGQRWLSGLHGPAGWPELVDRLARDEAARRSGPGERVDLSVLMPVAPGPAADAEAALIAETYPEGYPLENAQLALDFSPERVVAAIAPRALCLITPTDDTIIPAEHSVAMYERAGEPKLLRLLPDGGHGGPLGPQVDSTTETAVAFFDAHLRAAS